METWKKIDGFTNYEVSNTGLVKSLGTGKSTCPEWNKERVLSIGHTKRGYTKVKLFIDGKRKYFSVHKLVALTFLIKGVDHTEVNHKDGNKSNNSVENLEWCTSSHNKHHAFRTGLRKSKKWNYV